MLKNDATKWRYISFGNAVVCQYILRRKQTVEEEEHLFSVFLMKNYNHPHFTGNFEKFHSKKAVNYFLFWNNSVPSDVLSEGFSCKTVYSI